MRRQGIAGCSLAVLAPICLLALGALADLIFHHPPPPIAQLKAPGPFTRWPQRVQAAVVPVQPAPPVAPVQAQALDDDLLPLMHAIRRACPNPARADGCSTRTLTAALAHDMPAFRAHRRALERRYLARLASAFEFESEAEYYLPIHALGFLRSRHALPALRALLFRADTATAWHLEPPNEPAIFYADAQFPYHLALIEAIENIEGLPIRDAFKLTRAEHRRLSQAAAGCRRDIAAQWLLRQLAGTPLPTLPELRAHRAACRAAIRPG